MQRHFRPRAQLREGHPRIHDVVANCWQHSKVTGAAQCAATTQEGARCKRKAQPGKKYCWQHANYKPAAKTEAKKAEAKKGEAKPAAKKPAAKPAAKKGEAKPAAKKPEAKPAAK